MSNSDYRISINARGEIEIGLGNKAQIIGIPHRLPMPISELPLWAIKNLRESGRDPADYCICGCTVVRNSHRTQLERMIVEGKAKYASSLQGLREERMILVDRIRINTTEAAHVREMNFHKFDTGAGMGRNDNDVKADAATAALANFDAAHPEVKAAIEAEKAEAAKNSFWN